MQLRSGLIMVKRKSPKRLYADVSVVAIDKGYIITLDGKVLKTPAEIVVCTKFLPLIRGVALEWEQQTKEIDINKMSLFRLLVTSIDHVGPRREEVNMKTLQFGGMDLLCYRAQKPSELLRRQEEKWQPIFNWAEKRMGVSFRVTNRISPITQSQETMCAMEELLATFSDLEMTAVSSVTSATSSLLIGLALEADAISPRTAAEISILEEVYQMEKWGEDEIIVDRHNQLRKEIFDAYQFLKTLQ